MREPFSVFVGGMPYWCVQLMDSCPFLFSFEARCKYLRVEMLGKQPVEHHLQSNNSSRGLIDRQLSRKRCMVHRNKILDSQMIKHHARQNVVIEVEYSDEVGTGLGPTLEFYTLVSHEFQRSGLGMWRGDCMSGSIGVEDNNTNYHGSLLSPFGLFPCPWSLSVDVLGEIEFSEVLKKFFLQGQIVAKSLQDSGVLDLPFSRAF